MDLDAVKFGGELITAIAVAWLAGGFAGYVMAKRRCPTCRKEHHGGGRWA